MAIIDYSSVADLVGDVMRGLGQESKNGAVTLVVTTKGGYNSDTGETVGDTVAETAVEGVVFSDFELEEVQSSLSGLGQLIQVGDLKASWPANGSNPEPEKGHELRRGTELFRVMDVSTVDPAGVGLLHKAQLRRGG